MKRKNILKHKVQVKYVTVTPCRVDMRQDMSQTGLVEAVHLFLPKPDGFPIDTLISHRYSHEGKKRTRQQGSACAPGSRNPCTVVGQYG